MARSDVDPGLVSGDGFLCVGPTGIGRYSLASSALESGFDSVGVFDAGGRLQNVASTSVSGSGYDVIASLPSPPGPGAIQLGEWYFQCWFRDGPGSNLSDFVGLTF